MPRVKINTGGNQRFQNKRYKTKLGQNNYTIKSTWTVTDEIWNEVSTDRVQSNAKIVYINITIGLFWDTAQNEDCCTIDNTDINIPNL